MLFDPNKVQREPCNEDGSQSSAGRINVIWTGNPPTLHVFSLSCSFLVAIPQKDLCSDFYEAILYELIS